MEQTWPTCYTVSAGVAISPLRTLRIQGLRHDAPLSNNEFIDTSLIRLPVRLSWCNRFLIQAEFVARRRNASTETAYSARKHEVRILRLHQHSPVTGAGTNKFSKARASKCASAKLPNPSSLLSRTLDRPATFALCSIVASNKISLQIKLAFNKEQLIAGSSENVRKSLRKNPQPFAVARNIVPVLCNILMLFNLKCTSHSSEAVATFLALVASVSSDNAIFLQSFALKQTR